MPDDDCGEASGRPVILEGELPGEIGTRERGWLPGHCGLLHYPLYELVGLLAAAEVAEP